MVYSAIPFKDLVLEIISNYSTQYDFCRRPKCGDIKQQLLNKSTNYKLLYKSFLENELMKKLKDTKSTESKVTQLCQKLDDVQKRIQILTLKLNALNETVKCHIEKTRI